MQPSEVILFTEEMYNMDKQISNENADNVAKALVDYFVTKRGVGTTLTFPCQFPLPGALQLPLPE